VSSTVYMGRGSKLQISADGINFLTVAQLQKFAFSGLKTVLVDTTNLRSPGNAKENLPVQVDSGEVTFSGVLNPHDAVALDIPSLQFGLAQISVKIIVPDGTTYSFMGSISEYVPVAVEYSKALTFSGKINISGALTIIPGSTGMTARGFQVPGFQSPGFQSAIG